MANEDRNKPNIDPVLAGDNALRAQAASQRNEAEIKRIEAEAKRGQEKPAEQKLSPKEALRAEMDKAPRNLTEESLRGSVESFLLDRGKDPDEARDLARIRAAQMVGKDPNKAEG